MSSKWGGSCTFNGSTDKSSGDSTISATCPVYTSPSGVSVSGTASVTVPASGGQVDHGIGVSVNIPF